MSFPWKDIVETAKESGLTDVTFKNTELSDIIELKDIVQTYPGQTRPVLQGLNLLIEDKPNQGQFVVVLGPSGCGKSTLLRYVSGLQKPSSGKVLIHGKERTKEDKVGMVFQRYSSFPWLTVQENVELGMKFQNIPKKERQNKAIDMMKLVDIYGHRDKYAVYPTLSGGQLQRVAIARSLVSSPEILLMDEPFGALDIHIRLQMQDLLCKIWKELQLTVMFVTHDISEAVYLGDKIHIMRAHPGKIVKRIHVDLPLDRSRETKRSQRFIELVRHVEDEFMTVEELTREELKLNKKEE